MKKLLSIAASLLAGLVAATLVSLGQSSEGPDLWNITNGVVITDHSHFARWQTDSTAFDARDVFGGRF